MMKTAKELVDFLKNQLGYPIEIGSNLAELKLDNCWITFNFTKNKFSVTPDINNDHTRCFDLTREENCCVVVLLLKLLSKGYSYKTIYLEKCWPLGHNNSGYLDVYLISSDTKIVYMVEVKKQSEIDKYVNLHDENRTKQLFSYVIQDKRTKVAAYYSYDFENNQEHFYSLFTEELLDTSSDVDDLYDSWNKVFLKNDFIEENNVFNVVPKFLRYSDLETIEKDSASIIFRQFLTILRQYSVSDKPNAFMKIINLLLAKIKDEYSEDTSFQIKTKNGTFTINGLKFQYIDKLDTPESFMKRLNDLYKVGMGEYLDKNVIDYSDDEIEQLLGSESNDKADKILEAFDNLRLKRNHNFAFMDVYDETSFKENFNVVKDIVKLFESYKFKYDNKYQFLGDFFENLLSTSLKQEAGQFFTPIPIVNFMVKVLPYEELIKRNIEAHHNDFLPKIIDFACGAGHFLVCSMEHTQKILDSIADSGKKFTTTIDNDIHSFCCRPYSWVDERNVVGIEKDYRLAKTTKIATFLNGDGRAKVITADGVNKFNCDDYRKSVLYTDAHINEYFDFVVSNPPFSVEGYMRNFNRFRITTEDFSLFTGDFNYKDTMIEVFFVERTFQLLKPNGMTALILPQSVLSGDRYEFLRRYLFSHFKINAMLLTSDITFSGTTTSPVIFFMTKQKQGISGLNYETMLICSPKYLYSKTKKNPEIEFLGYEFSNDRNKSGVTEKHTSTLKDITHIVHEWVCNGIRLEESHPNIFIKKLMDIVINEEDDYVGDIYPKYEKVHGRPLSDFCKINSRTEIDFIQTPRRYIEISNITNSKIILKDLKEKSTTRYCKKGDILVSSLTPTKEKIVIADGEYMLSNAIFVLSHFKNEKEVQRIYGRLQNKDVLKQMNALTDGFKVTYAKISEKNLYNNILI